MPLLFTTLLAIIVWLLLRQKEPSSVQEADNPIISLCFQNIKDVILQRGLSYRMIKKDKNRQSMEIYEHNNIIYITSKIASEYPYTLTHNLEYHLASQLDFTLLDALLPCLNIPLLPHDFITSLMTSSKPESVMYDMQTKLAYHQDEDDCRLMMTYQTTAYECR